MHASSISKVRNILLLVLAAHLNNDIETFPPKISAEVDLKTAAETIQCLLQLLVLGVQISLEHGVETHQFQARNRWVGQQQSRGSLKEYLDLRHFCSTDPLLGGAGN